VWILKGDSYELLGTWRVALLRGKGLGLELVFAGRELGEAFEELEARLAERPGFYRGTSALANFGNEPASSDVIARLQSLLIEAGIELRAVTGSSEIEALARDCGLTYESGEIHAAPELERRRALRPRGEVKLSESARSLVADFAGARADIAQRRRRGEASVPQLELAVQPEPSEPERSRAAPLHVVEAPPPTLYHTGTLRGGQALHHSGNVVVVGDVNPGAEIVASGDVLVFGRLAGVAHAGAQGDEAARVFALDLTATQLRIATFIAADGENAPRVRSVPEAALVRDGRIVIVPFDQIDQLQERGISSV
jgi:septum site-determining protein MinC